MIQLTLDQGLRNNQFSIFNQLFHHLILDIHAVVAVFVGFYLLTIIAFAMTLALSKATERLPDAAQRIRRSQ